MQELGNVNLVDSSISKLIQIQPERPRQLVKWTRNKVYFFGAGSNIHFELICHLGVHGHGHAADSDLKTLLAFILCDGARQSFAQLKGKNDQVCIRWKKLRQGALVNTN